MSGYNPRNPYNTYGQNYHHGGSSQHESSQQSQQASRGPQQKSQPQAGGSRQQGATAGSHTSQSTSQFEEAQNFYKQPMDNKGPTMQDLRGPAMQDWSGPKIGGPSSLGGFSEVQAEELLSYGVKPWDAGAREFLEGLYTERRDYDRQNQHK